jgi:RNA polymerase sigma-70 factor (ECF subfamily)
MSTLCAVLAAAVFFAGSQNADNLSVQALAPSVVKTVPQGGDLAVDPNLKEIRATFSKDKADASWSWVQVSKASFPATTGKARYLEDRRTCVLPVKLEPGKTYVIWLNKDQFQAFIDTDGNAAVPYLLVFQTKK